MDRSQYERPAGRMLHRLNTETIKPVIEQTLIERGIGSPQFEVDEMVVARVKGDTFATICTEGVGWSVDSEGTLPITLFTQNGMRQDYIDLPVDVVLAHVSEEQVDLAQFVRVFGARLENNFHIWLNATAGVEQVFDRVVA